MADSIVMPATAPSLGAVVDLVMPDGQFMARGLFNSASRLAVRACVYREDEALDGAWLLARLDQAIDLRRRSTLVSQKNVRLVFSEADNLSGLIVDCYTHYLVVQQTAGALDPFMPALIDRLQEAIQPKAILWTVDEATSKLEGIPVKHQWCNGESPVAPVEIVENDVRLEIDLNAGQKTGYYLDQRDNRLAAANWMPSSGRILDVCTYVGGFALAIAKHCPGCHVVGIDSSSRAIDGARRHAQINNLSNVEFRVDDFLKATEQMVADKELFDGVVLDPPKLAGSRDSVDRALRAYHRLNYQAVKLLNPGGILVTCSCSGRVSREDFHRMLQGVAKQSRRTIQILEQRGPAYDHPVSVLCPETDYLKCFICRVLD